MIAPTAASLREWAKWFDNPNECPAVVVELYGRRMTSGYLLRRIAEEMDKCIAPEPTEEIE